MARPALTKLPPFTLLDESDPCRHPSVARAGEFRAVLEGFVWRLYVARASPRSARRARSIEMCEPPTLRHSFPQYPKPRSRHSHSIVPGGFEVMS